jgi:hypothetical protein
MLTAWFLFLLLASYNFLTKSMASIKLNWKCRYSTHFHSQRFIKQTINPRKIKPMKMTTIDWVIREERLRAFYGDIHPDFRFLVWKLNRKLAVLLKLCPRLATQSRRIQLWHLENYFIHAPAEVDKSVGPDIVTPPVEATPTSIMYEDCGTPFFRFMSAA